jgi:hypothetical protein
MERRLQLLVRKNNTVSDDDFVLDRHFLSKDSNALTFDAI